MTTHPLQPAKDRPLSRRCVQCSAWMVPGRVRDICSLCVSRAYGRARYQAKKAKRLAELRDWE